MNIHTEVTCRAINGYVKTLGEIVEILNEDIETIDKAISHIAQNHGDEHLRTFAENYSKTSEELLELSKDLAAVHEIVGEEWMPIVEKYANNNGISL